jgi:hypothetical protein
MVDSPLSGFGTPEDTEHLLPLYYASPRLQASAVVKTGPGTFYSITMTNTNAAARFLQVFDARDLPATGAIPLFSRSIPLGDSLTLTWTVGHTFGVGLIVCNSTTAASLTLGTVDSLFDVTYV